MRAKQFCVLTAAESGARIWRKGGAFESPGGLGCCPFWGGGSVVVDLLFGVLPIVCGSSVFCLCFVVHCFVSVLVLRSS